MKILSIEIEVFLKQLFFLKSFHSVFQVIFRHCRVVYPIWFKVAGSIERFFEITFY